MIIRLATVKDERQVLSLLNELGEVINELVSPGPNYLRAHELGKKNYQEAFKRNDRKVFVAENDGRIIGVATFFILTDFITGSTFAHIDDFVIQKSFRGKGIGGALLTYIKKYAKLHGIHTIKLTSSPQLIRAHKFYKKHGGVFAQRVIKFEL